MVKWKKKVLEQIRPDKNERSKVLDIQSRIIDSCNKFLDDVSADDVISVGSFSKDTWLSGSHDIDIFVRFPSKINKRKLEKRGVEIGKKVMEDMDGEWHIEYAEHPYVRGMIDGFEVDIVPCYDVSSDKIKSAVDRTPHHTNYVNSKLGNKQKNEVRLLKAFCHAKGIYGAKLSVEGVSGYLCELLIIKFGTFKKLINKAAKWTPGVKIKLGKKNDCKSPENVKEPLILIDPVDPKRNVASALSLENFIRFVSAAKDFKKKPSDKHFVPKKISPMSKSDFKSKLKKRKTNLISLEFGTPEIIDDILYPQMRKFEKRIRNILEEYEFEILRSNTLITKEKSYLLLEMKIWELPSVIKMVGPTAYSKKHTKEFFSKYKNPSARYLDGDKWAVEVEREWTLAGEKLMDTLKNKESTLKEKGVPSYIASSLSEGFKILEGDKIVSLLKDEEFGKFVSKYFSKDIMK